MLHDAHVKRWFRIMQRRQGMQRWRDENPELAKRRRREWTESHREHDREVARRWRENNPEKVQSKQERRKGTRYATEEARQARREYNRRYREQNFERIRERQRIWRQTSPRAKEIHRQSRYKFQFGITAHEVDAKIERQNWKCAICQESIRGKRAAHLDHCHETGTVRGVLCRRCNLGIGHLRDNSEMCERAAAYLRSYEKRVA